MEGAAVEDKKDTTENIVEQYPTVRVTTSDGETVDIKTEFAWKSTLIASVWDDQEDKNEAINLPEVSK